MCGCAEALVRAVVAFFNAFLVDCFLLCFLPCRPRPGPNSPASDHWDPLVPKDWQARRSRPGRRERCPQAEQSRQRHAGVGGDATLENLLIHYPVLLVLISLVVLLVLGALFVIPRSNIKGNMVTLVQASLAILFEAVFR
ncbi:hypothetical protein VPH35_101784 [Triticum aestivum]